MIKQVKYTILEVSKILVLLEQTYFPREKDLISGNQNLTYSLNAVLKLYNSRNWEC